MTGRNVEQSGRRVAVIGLGSMGYGMASTLLREGFDVVGFDVSSEVLSRFAQEGGRSAASPAEAVAGAAIVVCVVVNAGQTHDVLFGPGGCLEVMEQDAVFLSCATLAPEEARAFAGEVTAAGRAYLDAPISGGAQRAATGDLTILVSGSGTALNAARPVLDAMAERVYELGEAVGDASAFKIVNQLLAGVHIAAACEAMAFAAAQNLDLRRVYEVITHSAGNSWMFENRMPHVLDSDYRPRSMVDIFVKDLGIVADIARKGRIPVPVASAALQLFLMTSAAGMGRDDDASVARLFERINGVPVTGNSKE
ncbi:MULTISPECIES: L-threonate dehydrogenase [unclassified Chelatococcus]|uniref:L-threonate dehydrogenase n=1 Tax=unclassified Chelatococcus TaxID=2638111 RepID=UPI001BCC4C3E|nr:MULTISPECIES: L-threonate dehydrogenase [unclassified Chelatococcus]MBS7701019.1 NAD-binding protein [Chelatococcus sp. YT9]MBX3555552.1 NAD-binding protein [Chelatococcus sp.]